MLKRMIFSVAIIGLFGGGCGKKEPMPTPPSPPKTLPAVHYKKPPSHTKKGDPDSVLAEVAEAIQSIEERIHASSQKVRDGFDFDLVQKEPTSYSNNTWTWEEGYATVKCIKTDSGYIWEEKVVAAGQNVSVKAFESINPPPRGYWDVEVDQAGVKVTVEQNWRGDSLNGYWKTFTTTTAESVNVDIVWDTQGNTLTVNLETRVVAGPTVVKTKVVIKNYDDSGECEVWSDATTPYPNIWVKWWDGGEHGEYKTYDPHTGNVIASGSW